MFLKLCLEDRDAGDGEYAFESEVLEDFQMGAEVTTDHGRIDILLEKDDACIVIENKIYAADQDHQLNRYLFVLIMLPAAHRWAVGRWWQTRASPRMKMRFVDGEHRLSNQT